MEHDIPHYSDVIMGGTASQISSLTIAYSTVIHAQIKDNVKASRRWPFCGEFTGHRWIPAQMASNAEIVYIWWRHHASALCDNAMLYIARYIRLAYLVVVPSVAIGRPVLMLFHPSVYASRSTLPL